MNYDRYTKIKVKLDDTMCRVCYKKKIRVNIHFGPYAPGICDECLEEMVTVIMDNAYSLHPSIMEKKDV